MSCGWGGMVGLAHNKSREKTAGHRRWVAALRR
jgi:hypothetical protein